MFNQLLESKPKKQRSLTNTMYSVGAHVVLIAVAVYLTAKAGIADDSIKQEKIQFVEVKPEEPAEPEPPKKAPPPPDAVITPPPPKGFQILQAPVDVPTTIPDVDLTRKVTDESDFSGKGVIGGISHGVVGGSAPVVEGQPYMDFQVDQAVVGIQGTINPTYPEVLRASGVEGRVMAQFVVDTLGKIEKSTFKILESTNELFSMSVRSALPRMRFYPAQVNGRKVKQLVQQPFQFTLGN